MSIKYTSLAVGEPISWPAINGRRTGIVESLDDRGAMVALGNGKYVLLTTGQSMEVTKNRRRAQAHQLRKRRAV